MVNMKVFLIVLSIASLCLASENQVPVSQYCAAGCAPGYSCCDGSNCFYDDGFYRHYNCVDGGSIDAPSCCYSWTVITWIIVIICFAIHFLYYGMLFLVLEEEV